MARTVRFHQAGGPEVLRLDDVDPGEPDPGEVRVRVDAIGINRAEVLFRRDQYIEPVKQFPSRLGAEAAGVVEAIGPDVTGFAPGQAISVIPAFSQNDYGVYAEQAIVPASALVNRPDGIDAVAGAAVWMPYLTAYGAMVEIAGLRAGRPSSSTRRPAASVSRRSRPRTASAPRRWSSHGPAPSGRDCSTRARPR